MSKTTVKLVVEVAGVKLELSASEARELYQKLRTMLGGDERPMRAPYREYPLPNAPWPTTVPVFPNGPSTPMPPPWQPSPTWCGDKPTPAAIATLNPNVIRL